MPPPSLTALPTSWRWIIPATPLLLCRVALLLCLLGLVSPRAGAEDAPRVQDQGTVRVIGRSVEGYSVFEASTATKTDTPLMELPQSIQVIPEQVFADQQIVDIGGVLENVSGVQASGTDRIGLVDRFVARGFSLSPRSNFYKNGRPFIFSVPPPTETLERVEFLKGPASVLYGQAEPGGIVNMVLKRPTPEPFLKTSVQSGSFDYYKVHLDVGGPLGRTLGARANLSYTNTGSFRDFQDREQFVASGTLHFDPAPWLAINVNGSFQDREQAADSGLTAAPAEIGQSPSQNFGLGDRVVDVPISRSLNEPWTRLDVQAEEVGYGVDLALNEHWQLRHSGSWQHQTNDELRADPRTIQSNDIPFLGIERGDLARIFRDRRTERTSFYVEASLLGEFDLGPTSHRVLLGGEAFDSTAEFTEFLPIFNDQRAFNVFSPTYSSTPPPLLGATLFRVSRGELRQSGVYLQEQLTAFDWVHVLAGVRYDTFSDGLESTNFNARTGQVEAAPLFVDQRQSALTYRAGLLLNPVDWVSAFLSYSESFRPNLDPFGNEQLDPEEGEQIEAGLKFSLLDGFVLATVTAFDLTKTNVVIVNPVSQVLNVAGERSARGVEVDLVGELLPGWNVVANYAYLVAEVTKGDPRPEDTPGVSTVPIAGNTPPASPRHSGKLWMTYRFQSARLFGLRLGAGVFVRTGVQGDLFNTLQHPGFARLDAMLGWQGTLGGYKVDLQVNLRNLLDKVYFSGTNRDFIKPGKPFSLLGQVSIRF